MHLKINFDGAVTKSQLGTDMGIGVAVFINGQYYEELSRYLFVPGFNKSSSNVAEWIGCVEAFKLAAEYKEPGDIIEIFSDSQIISYQYNGDYAIKKDEFRVFYNNAKMWAKTAGLENLKIKWVKREFNKEADRLSKKGLHSTEVLNV